MKVFVVTEERYEYDDSVTFRNDSIWSTLEKANKRLNELAIESTGLFTYDIEEIELDTIL